MRHRRLAKVIALVVILGLLMFALTGCAPASALWDSIRQLFGGAVQETTVPAEPNGPSDSQEPSDPDPDPDSDTTPTTSEPEGEEFVRVARKLDPLLWEVGEKLYYIDLNTHSLHYRYDLKDEETDLPMAPVTEVLTDQVSAIIGFSTERIFCLSDAMTDSDGRFVYDVVAVDYTGSHREVVSLQINNGAVIDNEWLVVSRFNQPFQILVVDLVNEEEHVVFEDDGNLYPGMTQIDVALGCYFEYMSDGLRIDVAYPGYSEYPFMRYLLLVDGAITEDSKSAPWQDNLGEILFEQGMVQEMQRVKTYGDLVLYVQSAGLNDTLMVYDHPDGTKTLIDGDEYYVIDFFYHDSKVLVPVFWPFASGDQSTEQVLLYDPVSDQESSLANVYERYFQFENTLAAIRVNRISEEMTNNVTGRLMVDRIGGDGQAVGNLFDQTLVTGSTFGDFSYNAWQAGHDLVIYYDTHQPEVGQVTSTSYQWIFINLRDG